jgi:hypothetical protein
MERSIALPKVVVSATVWPNKSDELTAHDVNPNIPKEVMDEIQQVIGNGLARVTVSADFGIKDYGTGASAMCSVSLTCNQDIQTIERAARIAGDLARDLAQVQRQNAETELQGILAGRTQGGRPPYAG